MPRHLTSDYAGALVVVLIKTSRSSAMFAYGRHRSRRYTAPRFAPLNTARAERLYTPFPVEIDKSTEGNMNEKNNLLERF